MAIVAWRPASISSSKLTCPAIWIQYIHITNQCRTNYTGCRFTIVSNSKLPQWHIKQYITVTPHIWLIWSSGKLHAELYSLLLPTFSLLLVVTSSFGAQGFRSTAPAIWNSLPLTFVLMKLSQHSADTWNLIFSTQLCDCLATHLSASDSFTTMALYKFTYLLTYQPQYQVINPRHRHRCRQKAMVLRLVSDVTCWQVERACKRRWQHRHVQRIHRGTWMRRRRDRGSRVMPDTRCSHAEVVIYHQQADRAAVRCCRLLDN